MQLDTFSIFCIHAIVALVMLMTELLFINHLQGTLRDVPMLDEMNVCLCVSVVLVIPKFVRETEYTDTKFVYKLIQVITQATIVSAVACLFRYGYCGVI